MNAPAKAFAGEVDLQDKQVGFTKLSEQARACAAEGGPNSGVVLGDLRARDRARATARAGHDAPAC